MGTINVVHSFQGDPAVGSPLISSRGILLRVAGLFRHQHGLNELTDQIATITHEYLCDLRNFSYKKQPQLRGNGVRVLPRTSFLKVAAVDLRKEKFVVDGAQRIKQMLLYVNTCMYALLCSHIEDLHPLLTMSLYPSKD